MELSEALRASKIRKASGYLVGDMANTTGLSSPVAAAGDSHVTFVAISVGEIVDLSWADILPPQKKFLFGLRWEPVEPKDPLTQLAEALTDWRED